MALKVVNRAIGVVPTATTVTWAVVERFKKDGPDEENGYKIVAYNRFTTRNRQPETVLTDMDSMFATKKQHKFVTEEAANLPVGLVTMSGQILTPIALWLQKKGFHLFRLISAISELDEQGNSFNRQFTRDILRSNDSFRREIFGSETGTPPDEFMNMLSQGRYEHGKQVVNEDLRKAANAAASIIVMYDEMTPPRPFLVTLIGQSR